MRIQKCGIHTDQQPDIENLNNENNNNYSVALSKLIGRLPNSASERQHTNKHSYTQTLRLIDLTDLHHHGHSQVVGKYCLL